MMAAMFCIEKNTSARALVMTVVIKEIKYNQAVEKLIVKKIIITFKFRRRNSKNRGLKTQIIKFYDFRFMK